uniref:Uncharacterized protein n=1 Tax=Arundo donax TaxID=35708 RepID=A0A0A9FFS7_ARUDO
MTLILFCRSFLKDCPKIMKIVILHLTYVVVIVLVNYISFVTITHSSYLCN